MRRVRLRPFSSEFLLLAVIICDRYSIREAYVNRNNLLYMIIGALVIAVAALGYQLYQDRHPPPPPQGVHIDVGPNGLSIQGK